MRCGGITKKGMRSGDHLAQAVIDSVSKGALADLVIDLLRRNAGNELLNGEELARAFAEAFEPIANVRGDKCPNVAAYVDKLAKQRAKVEARRARSTAMNAATEE